MKELRLGPFLLCLAFGLLLAMLQAPQRASAQTAEESMKHSCSDASRAFSLRQQGTEGLVVADPGATSELRHAALLFYECAQRESDPYMHELFLAYYASTLYRVAKNANDSRAASLAEATAQRLSSSQYDDVRALVATVTAIPSHDQRATPATHQVTRHSDAYCQELKPNMINALGALEDAVVAASNAGTNDTQVLATTTARYGDAFKTVEDDFSTAQSDLGSAQNYLNAANSSISGLNEQEKDKVTKALGTTGWTINYTDTYSRLALAFERGINASNRALARARIAQALSAGAHNSSYTYTNGSASCSSFSSYTANCNGSSYSTTTYNNSGSIAQQNAANALAAAQAGRLSYGQADEALSEGLPLLNQMQSGISGAVGLWTKGCTRT